MVVGCAKQAGDSPSEEAPPSAASPAPEPEVAPPVVALTPWVEIPAVTYRPLYPGKDEPKERALEAFALEAHPVTNAQFLRFVWEEPKWRKGAIRGLFADENYLQHWPSDLQIPAQSENAPVTNVSWFAARAYAKWAQRRLPMLAEWEYVAAASDRAAQGREDPRYNQTILNWYAKKSPLVPDPVQTTTPNFYGVFDMHGLIWEWVEDFNTAMVTGESRGDAGLDRNLFCGSGSIGTADPSDYAAFMRFAFRSSLEANYTVRNLGFRCALSRQP